MSVFDMKDLGPVRYILGIEVVHKEGKVSLSQKGYIKKLLDKFNMSECYPVSTPLEVGKKLVRPSTKSQSEEFPYQNLVGCLMYLAVCCRPDISHAVSVLSQFNSSYDREHWQAALRVLKYLKGTMDYHLNYQSTGEYLQCFVDASYISDVYDAKSRSGFVFVLASSAVSWESRKQTCTAMSSAEAEFVSICEATREAMFLRRFIKELTGKSDTVKMFTDSQSAQALAYNPVHHNRTKHISPKYYYIRECVQKNAIKLQYVSTTKMVADSLTKAVVKPKFLFCSQAMGLVPSS